MIVARLIKAGTPLYQTIRNQIRFLDGVFLARPPLFFPVWTMVMAGISAAAATRNPEIYWVRYLSWRALFLFSGVTLLAGGTFIQYQIRNRLADKINQKVSLVEETDIPERKVQSLIKVLIVSGLVVILSTYVAQGTPLGIIWGLLLYASWGAFHNGSRFQWSGKPILGTATHGLAGLSLFMMGWIHALSDPFSGLVPSLPYILKFMAWFLVCTVADAKGDRRLKKNTFAIRFGDRPAIGWAALLLSASAFMGHMVGDPVISTAAIVSLPFFLVALIFTRMDHVQRAVRYPVFILAMFICVRYPWFFVALLLTFYASKYYYYFRFNVDYPTFHVSHE